MKILYAEDELQLSMAVTEILKMEEYEVDAVYDGEEALEHVLNQEYDAIILDIMMPKKSGIEVVTAMRDKGIFTPVMLLTAKNETDDRIAGLSSGADDYLGKPFAMGELIARLNAMLRRTTQYKTKTIASGNISLNCETGELKSDQGSLLTQPYVNCERLATKEEIDEMVMPKGFRDNWNGQGVNYISDRLALEDMHPANVFIDALTGKPICIDCIVKFVK